MELSKSPLKWSPSWLHLYLQKTWCSFLFLETETLNNWLGLFPVPWGKDINKGGFFSSSKPKHKQCFFSVSRPRNNKQWGAFSEEKRTLWETIDRRYYDFYYKQPNTFFRKRVTTKFMFCSFVQLRSLVRPLYYWWNRKMRYICCKLKENVATPRCKNDKKNDKNDSNYQSWSLLFVAVQRSSEETWRNRQRRDALTQIIQD